MAAGGQVELQGHARQIEGVESRSVLKRPRRGQQSHLISFEMFLPAVEIEKTVRNNGLSTIALGDAQAYGSHLSGGLTFLPFRRQIDANGAARSAKVILDLGSPRLVWLTPLSLTRHFCHRLFDQAATRQPFAPR